MTQVQNQILSLREGNNMAWIYLVIASFGEIFGVMSINLYLQKKNFTWLCMIILSMGLGFAFLSLAMRDIPLGTAYAIWTGLGAAGAVIKIGRASCREREKEAGGAIGDER